MKLVRRGVAQALMHLVNALVAPAELVAPRAYMRFYIWFLERYGVRFTGAPRYISSRVKFDDYKLVTLGERAVLSRNVILLTHDYSITTALIANGKTPASDIAVRRPIRVGNNVFIGMNVIVMPGTEIGDNVIVGAGSVVRGVVEPDSILIGNPALKIGRLTERQEMWIERSQGKFASAD
jgi:acetyltransferase-like isoleucine patch superfamily enzyme